MPSRLFYSLPALALVLCGCSPDEPVSDRPVSIDAWLPLAINEVEIEAQIAVTPPEMRKGLMYRESLAENSGMLFAYAAPRQVSFWMANTPLPLDIGFFDGDGVLKEVHRMVPFDTIRTVSRSGEIKYALEMNRGWYSRNSLYPGARLDLGKVASALSRRGMDPQAYGLNEPK